MPTQKEAAGAILILTRCRDIAALVGDAGDDGPTHLFFDFRC